jgi:TatD DNase family protein
VIVDTHCHLDAQYCPDGPDPVIQRARDVGVTALVAIGVGSVEAARGVIALAARRPDVVCTVGVHPHDANTADDALVSELTALSSTPDVVAIGEIGLDYHYDHSPRDVQKGVFRRFIALARERRLPIVVHTRSAPEDTLAILEEEQARDVGGIIHCFSEDRAFAARALDLGFDISFSGIVTFKSATAIQDVARWAPEDRILLETDSPYLAPVPKRGKPNEPAFIVHTATHLATLRSVPVATIEAKTTENAVRRFGPRLDAAVRAGHA